MDGGPYNGMNATGFFGGGGGGGGGGQAVGVNPGTPGVGGNGADGSFTYFFL
jgi:hypothetical protein